MGDYKTIFDVSSALKDFLSKHSQEDKGTFNFKNTDFTLSPPEKASQSNASPKPKISIYKQNKKRKMDLNINCLLIK